MSAFVKVRRQPTDYRIARYALAELENVRWDYVSGGIGAVSPHPYLHGYVQCDAMLDGELAHSGVHGKCPHRIKVCITKKDNDPAVFEYFSRLAGPKPKTPRWHYKILHDGVEIWSGVTVSEGSARRRARKALGLDRLPRNCEVTADRVD